MGQVFRARDTKLDRDVAMKILPEAFAHDADRLARFQREAKTLASLNHQNIAAIYGLEESGGDRLDGVGGGPGIFVRAADGTGAVERLTTGRHAPTSWSSDGTRIFYSDFGTNAPGPTVPSDLAVMTLTGDRRTETLLATAARESNVEIAPKGSWLAYETTEAGEKAIYVRPFPDVSARQWRVSSAGGVSPRWSRDGSTLFYRNGQAIMAVSVGGATPDGWSAPEKLLRVPISSSKVQGCSTWHPMGDS